MSTEIAEAVGLHVERSGGMRVPLKSWANAAEESALEQGRNLAKLPFALHHVALMADAHTGYGMPIGGVLFTDHVVIPYAVGVDIGCGVSLVSVQGSTAALGGDPRASAERVVRAIARRVPVGNGPQAEHVTPGDDGFDLPEDASITLMSAVDAARKQLGTLGGGNHFIELQASEDGGLYVMLHSGSRSVGKKTCDHHHKVAQRLMKRWRIELPDPNLAWLPTDTEEGRAYWTDMDAALRWAEENRRRMADAVVYAVREVLDVDASVTHDIHHNYAAMESHYGKNGVVHRKGAVRARAGEVVLIPGSMGTASYVAEGLGSAESFHSCQHGAGRAMSRAGARKAMAGRDIYADIGETVLVTPDRNNAVDEAPIAYKDIEDVMARSRDLVRPTMRLRPLAVLKG